MKRLSSRVASLLRRLLALLGLAGSVGAALPVQAVPLPQRPSLDARVAEARRQIASEEANEVATPTAKQASSADDPATVAQANNWNNWPNFNNWSNWANG